MVFNIGLGWVVIRENPVPAVTLTTSLDRWSARIGRELNDDRVKDVSPEKEVKMLWTIAVILLVLWVLGLVTSFTAGGFIHILLVLAIIAVVINLIQGRRTAI